MLNGQSDTTFVKSSGDCHSWTFPTDFCNWTVSPLTTFSWDSPALTFRKKFHGQTIVQHFNQRNG
ncbi:MAG: hypothetical protein HY063_11800 [Bacteroidetes bacterium]|nr:hypothetical protein [Bacteroidota bacterium]